MYAIRSYYALVFELVDRLHQADVPLLNQVEELQSAVGVFLGDGDDQAKVCFDQFALGLLGPPLPLVYLLERLEQLLRGEARLLLDPLELALGALQALLHRQQGVVITSYSIHYTKLYDVVLFGGHGLRYRKVDRNVIDALLQRSSYNFV